jgi:hypothetical protein
MAIKQSERTNLGAHVDLCAERYQNLENKLDNLEKRMGTMEEHMIVIRTKLSEASSAANAVAAESGNKASGQIINIGTAFGVALMTGLITVLVQLILK